MRNLLKNLFGEGDGGREIAGLLSVACISCGWSSECVETRFDPDKEIKIPHGLKNQARDHFLGMNGIGSMTIFTGKPEFFGEEHRYFSVGVENEGRRVIYRPVFLFFEDGGKSRTSNDIQDGIQ